MRKNPIECIYQFQLKLFLSGIFIKNTKLFSNLRIVVNTKKQILYPMYKNMFNIIKPIMNIFTTNLSIIRL